jgi:alpha-L-fucosidase
MTHYRALMSLLRFSLPPAGLLVLVLTGALPAAEEAPGNRPERLEWFRDAGFGLFIHWGPDVQLGAELSHSMVGASEDYLKRYIEQLPKTFNPRKFHPEDWAVLARLAGVRYVVFTAKHHCGFCMFRTKTTDFSMRATPFQRDITAEVLQAFREQGIAPGLYYSPDDFLWLYRHGKAIQRGIPAVLPVNNPGLMEYDKAHLRELLSNYGAIGVLFLDGSAEGLRELAWQLQPNIVVTRGALETPEQHIPGAPIDSPWEACLTMGTQWHYRPTREIYKSGTDLIELLIETRAKGGNLLLNVGPKPDGELPIEQEERLREMALWNFVNGEAIQGVRPWVVTNEDNIWFTRKKGEDTVYALITRTQWKFGEWKSFTLKSVKATKDTTVAVLGQSGEVLEYHPDVAPRPQWRQDEQGLHVTAMRTHRLTSEVEAPNLVVLKLTHVQPGAPPPQR